MVVTLTDGVVEKLGPDRATTSEHVFVFRDDDFDDADKRKQMVDVAVASAAFPVAFAPKELAGFGLGYDGGLVANTPVKEAIVGSGIERIFVIDPQPAQVAAGGLLHGTELLSHLGDILVRERLFRDLSDAYECNDALARLTGLVATGAADGGQHATVLATLGWRSDALHRSCPCARRRRCRGRRSPASSTARCASSTSQPGKRRARSRCAESPAPPACEVAVRAQSLRTPGPP